MKGTVPCRSALLIACVLLASIVASADDRTPLATRTTKLGPMPSSKLEHLAVLSPDGRRWAVVIADGDRRLLFCDGKRSGPFDLIGKPVFSRDGKHLAFDAVLHRKGFVVRDGRAGAFYDQVPHPPVFSPEGTRLAYWAVRGEKCFVVTDGVAGPAFAERDVVVEELRPPLFSPDGRRLAYAGPRGEKTVMVLDGRAGPACDEIREPVFSPNGRRLAYFARSGKQWYVVCDGKIGPAFDALAEKPWRGNLEQDQREALAEGKRFTVFGGDANWADEILYYRPHFSADGKRLAYWGKRGKKHFIVIGGTESPPYDRAEPPIFSPDGRHLAYCARSNEKGFVVLDGTKGPNYDYAQWLTLSPDGTRLAYAAMRGEKSFMVCDGKEGPTFDLCRPPVFSADGRHVAYYAKRKDKNRKKRVYELKDEVFVVRDGKEGPAYAGAYFNIFYSDPSPTFSPDGKHLAYVGRRAGRSHVVCDGMESRPYEAVTRFIAFSSDSRHLVYEAQSDGKRFIVCDGVEGPPYEWTRLRPTYTPAIKTLWYVASDGKHLWRVEVDWPKDRDWRSGMTPVKR